MPVDIEKIKRLREKMKLSQQEAAEKAKLSGGRQRWSAIEAGRKSNITVETLERIAAALGCKARDLLR